MNKEQLELLINEGLSTYKIGKRLNKSQTTIRYWINKFDLKTNPYKNSLVIINNKGILFKKCCKCKEPKELNDNNYYIRNDGRFHSWCKKCNDSSTVKKQRERKQIAVNYKGGKCVCCGYDKYIGSLDFHHLDPSKKDFSISNIKNYSLESIKIELDKCILVCSNCHREIHGGLIKLNGGHG